MNRKLFVVMIVVFIVVGAFVGVSVYNWFTEEPTSTVSEQPSSTVPSIVGETNPAEPEVEEPPTVIEETPPKIDGVEDGTNTYTENVPEIIATNPAWIEYIESEYYDPSYVFNFNVTSDRIDADYVVDAVDIGVEYVFGTLYISVMDMNTRETLAEFESE